jgi:hypothetical protein
MYLSYNSTKIIPAPFVKFTTEINRTQDGAKVGKNLIATLSGKFVYGRGGATHTGSGYPANDYSKCALDDLLTKQQDLRDLFAEDHMLFEIQPDPEASADIYSWSARVRSIEFPEGLLNPVEDYIVVLELQHATWDSVQSIEESWELSEQESPRETYTLTHKISCNSREEWNIGSSALVEGWKKSLDYLTTTMGGLGIDGGIVYADPGLNLDVSFIDYNYLVSKVLDESNGRFDATETWTMSANPYTEEQSMSAEFDRDAPDGQNWTITIDGSITGFDTGGGGGWSNVTTRWTAVESALYTDASTMATNLNPAPTLRTQPKTKREVHDELNRVLSYTVVYEEGTGTCNEDVTVTVSTNDPECDVWTVTVEGTITGIKDGSTSAYSAAVACYGAIDTDTLANTAYSNSGGSGTLHGPLARTVRHNEYGGTIGFSATYNDRGEVFKHEKTVSVQYQRSEDVTSVTVEGTITGDCSGTWADVAAELATMNAGAAYSEAGGSYTGSGTLCSYPETSQTAETEINRVATYSYTFSDDPECGAEVSQSVTVKMHPTQCGYFITAVEGNILGRRSSGGSPWDNANTEYDNNHQESQIKTVAGDYVSGTLHKQSSSVTHSEGRFTISYSYEFTNEGTYTIDETITESWSEECGITKIVQNGTVKGLCTGDSGSAYANAETGYATVTDPSGAVNKIRNSESHNENAGTITYTKEFDDRSNPYVIDYTETRRERIDDCWDVVTIEGSVVGVCTNNTEGSKLSNAEAGFGSIDPLQPTENSPTGWKQASKSVGKNEYAGRVTFSYEYKEKSSCIPNAISESVEVTEEEPSDVYAVVNVLGGSSVIQDKGGSTARKRTVNIQVQVEPNCTGCSADIGGGPNVENIVNDAEPSAGIVVVQTNTKSWNPRTGRYTRVKAWVFGDC